MTKRKGFHNIRLLISLAMVISLLSTTQPIMVSGDWSDNFPVDGEPSDWEIFTTYRFGAGDRQEAVTDENHLMKVQNGALMAPHYDDLVEYGRYFALARDAWHNSTQIVGTWSFDWIVSEEPGRTHGAIIDLVFIFDRSDEAWLPTGLTQSEWSENITSYMSLNLLSHSKSFLGAGAAWNVSGPGITLGYMTAGSIDSFIYKDTYLHHENIQGTHHIDIIREASGAIEIYFDKALIIATQGIVDVISSKFAFSTILGDTGIDNMVVTSSINRPNTNSIGNSSDNSDNNELNWTYVLGGGVFAIMFIITVFGPAKKKF